MERWVSWFQNSLRTRKQDCVWLHFPWGGTPIAPQFRPLLHLLTSLSQTWWNHISSSSSAAEAVASLLSDLVLKIARTWSCRILIYSQLSLKASQKLCQSMSWSAFQERKQGKLSRSLASPYLGCSCFWSALTPWNLFAHNFGLICTTLAFGCNKAMVILLKHSKSISNQFGFATKWMQWKSAVGRDLGNINLWWEN